MRFLKGIIKKYFSTFVYFYKYLKYRIFIVVGLSIAVGTLDAFGLTMFLPILELADGDGTATGENLGNMSIIVEWFNSLGIELNLAVALTILAIFFILKGAAVYISSFYKIIVEQYFISTLRLNLTRLFTKYSFKIFASASDIGRIQNSFTSEISKVSLAYSSYSTGMQSLIMTFIYMVFVFLIDWNFALLVCIGGLLANVIYSSIYKNTKKESRELTKKNSGYHRSIIQYINNFKYLKATGYLKEYSINLTNDIKNIEGSNKKIGLLNSKITASREPLLIIIVCTVILIQIYALDGNLTSILMSLLLFYRALTQLMNFQSTYNRFLANIGSIDNIHSFEKDLKRNAEIDGNKKFDSFKDAIYFNNVSFGYGRDIILKSINLKINKNETIAFVGESGSGKTTLVNLICGLLPVDSGDIEIDKQNLNEIKKESYQRKIGYISQEPVIFNDTIFNNVTFWSKPTEENIERFNIAVKKASISEFINALSKKEQTKLGNNGVNLSGGQKQRISIARELYKNIDILILDEATSALDSETEREIQDNIDELKGKYTIIIIAHRLSTIKKADKIYLMSKGEIEEQGNFEELCEKSNKFRRMVELQDL